MFTEHNQGLANELGLKDEDIKNKLGLAKLWVSRVGCPVASTNGRLVLGSNPIIIHKLLHKIRF